MEFSDNHNELVGESKLGHDSSQLVTTDDVKCLSQVHERVVHSLLLIAEQTT